MRTFENKHVACHSRSLHNASVANPSNGASNRDGQHQASEPHPPPPPLPLLDPHRPLIRNGELNGSGMWLGEPSFCCPPTAPFPRPLPAARGLFGGGRGGVFRFHANPYLENGMCLTGASSSSFPRGGGGRVEEGRQARPRKLSPFAVPPRRPPPAARGLPDVCGPPARPQQALPCLCPRDLSDFFCTRREGEACLANRRSGQREGALTLNTFFLHF